MQTSRRTKSLFTVLPLLAVMTAVVIGLFMAKDLYPASSDSQVKTPIQLPAEQNNLQPLNLLETADSCSFGHFYTSLPPKCRTFDGSFVQADGTTPYFFVIPKTK